MNLPIKLCVKFDFRKILKDKDFTCFITRNIDFLVNTSF